LGALMGWIARQHGTYGIWREGKACLPFVFARSAFVGIDGRVCLGRLVWRPAVTAMFYAIRYDMRKRESCLAARPQMNPRETTSSTSHPHI
jgi:hypothetical protein